MKFRGLHLILLVITCLYLTSCNSSGGKEEKISTDLVKNPNTAGGENNSGSLPVFKFVEIEHDFGKIIQGESVSYDFKFTNTGKSDLIIVDVSTSCGCTVPSFPKTPIRAGETGVIKVSFNSAGKFGFQAKNILVVANTQPNTTLLRIKAQVTGPNSEK
jgi:predicted small secreted protein